MNDGGVLAQAIRIQELTLSAQAMGAPPMAFLRKAQSMSSIAPGSLTPARAAAALLASLANGDMMCRVCGCTDRFGCPQGCRWAQDGLCDRCEAHGPLVEGCDREVITYTGGLPYARCRKHGGIWPCPPIQLMARDRAIARLKAAAAYYRDQAIAEGWMRF